MHLLRVTCFVLLFVFFLSTKLTLAQGISIQVISNETVIRGTVTASDNNLPLPGVNVYLNNTTVGTATNRNGTFEIRTTLRGNHELIFSFIGYTTEAVPIVLKGSDVDVSPILQERLYKTRDVVVTSSNKAWLKNFERFRTLFIGRSLFAEQTLIENYLLLEFDDKDRRSFSAQIKEPMVIINNALGYKLRLDLIDFNWNLFTQDGRYLTYQFFEELEPEDENQRRLWEKNRTQAFRGSVKHFFHSLFFDINKDQGFRYNKTESLNRISGLQLEFLETAGEITQTDQYDYYYFARPIEVDMRKDTYWQGKSELIPVDPPLYIGFDRYGNLFDPYSIRVFGEMAKNRVAEQLPYDYVFEW